MFNTAQYLQEEKKVSKSENEMTTGPEAAPATWQTLWLLYSHWQALPLKPLKQRITMGQCQWVLHRSRRNVCESHPVKNSQGGQGGWRWWSKTITRAIFQSHYQGHNRNQKRHDVIAVCEWAPGDTKIFQPSSMSVLLPVWFAGGTMKPTVWNERVRKLGWDHLLRTQTLTKQWEKGHKSLVSGGDSYQVWGGKVFL